jgi:hypothetical protein
MALAVTGERTRVWRLASLERVPLIVWCVLGVALFALSALGSDASRLTDSLGDTDDATRLILVRELIAGAPWLDTTLHRFGAPDPLVSHWSRLVDAPLAVLLSAFDLVLPAAEAELATRAVWPLLVLLAFVYFLARETELRGGRAAALVAILLTVTCLFGITQFLPGRIDHHNVIIVGAVIGILRLARSFDDAEAGWSAGVFLGLGTAVGYEALALTVASLGAAVVFGALPGRSLLGPSRAAVTFAATLAIALSLTTASDVLFSSRCDALSFNLVVLAATAALGVCVVQVFETRLSLAAKIALLAAAGLPGIGLYALAEPACLAGPFGQVDPALFPVWLGSVSETQSMLSLGSQLPLLGGITFLYYLVGANCGFRLMQTDSDQGLRFHLIAFLLAIPLSVWQIKLIPYATFLPIPLIAVWLARPPLKSQTRKGHRRSTALIAVGTLLLIAVASYVLLTVSEPSINRVKAKIAPIKDCTATAAIAPLAKLPKGLAVADVNLGPYIVALTDLDVLSAPYHRMSKSILEADRILHAPPQEAEQRLKALGARYVITCKGMDSTTPASGGSADSLQEQLFADRPPAFLEPVPLDGQTQLKVWRLAP